MQVTESYWKDTAAVRVMIRTDPELKQWSNFRAPDGGVLRQYNKKRNRFRASRVTYDTNGQKLGVVLAR